MRKYNQHILFAVTQQELAHSDWTEPEYIGEFRCEGLGAAYEHPLFGDEAPLLVNLNGTWYETEYYDLEG